MERKIFRGVGAVIANIKSARSYQVFTLIKAGQVVDFTKTERLLDVDLDASPAKGPWDKVMVDDRGVDPAGKPVSDAMKPAELKYNGVTSLGSELPRGCMVGGVYLEQKYFDDNRANKIEFPNGVWPPAGWYGYELQTIVYADKVTNGARAKKRYAGFHGRIRRGDGSMAFIEILSPVIGPRDPVGAWWFDLSSPDECDDTAPTGETLLTTAMAANTEGAIYIELTRAAQLGLSGPKLPIGLGG